MIVTEWNNLTVAAYEVKLAGRPRGVDASTFIDKFDRPWGAYFEPTTGDYLFLSWGPARTKSSSFRDSSHHYFLNQILERGCGSRWTAPLFRNGGVRRSRTEGLLPARCGLDQAGERDPQCRPWISKFDSPHPSLKIPDNPLALKSRARSELVCGKVNVRW